MVRQLAKEAPKYGVVYPNKKGGIKIIHAFTDAPKKIIEPDGSVSYTKPAPTIYELYGGGFTYSNGTPVTKRGDLESISSIKMRERALSWFDKGAEISNDISSVPAFDPDNLKRPEPIYNVSTGIQEDGSPAKFIEERKNDFVEPEDKKPEIPSQSEMTSVVAQVIASLNDTLQAQNRKIESLHKFMEGEMERRKLGHYKHSMKFHDPAVRKLHGEKIRAAKQAKKIERERLISQETQA